MKNLLVLGLVFITSYLRAQDSKIELTPTAGYSFNGRTYYVSAESDLSDAASYGAQLSYRIYRDNLVELMYYTSSTEASTTIFYGRNAGTELRTTPLTVSYFQLGGTREFSTEKVRPYTAFSVGATLFHPTDKTSSNLESMPLSNSDIWAFSATLGGGVKVLFSERVGLRLNARLMLPMYFSGVGIYCGGGCGGGASFGVYFAQLDLSGGLIINLGTY
ncbi:MAG: hypothetical protein RIC15_11785 [Vicingaceae bacterium]